MTNHNPSLQNQFLAALLAFTTLLYGNVWLMAQSSRPAETAGYAVDSQPAQGVPPDFSGWSREEVGEYLVREVRKQISQPNNYFAAAAAVTGNTASAATPPPANAPVSSSPTPTPTPQTQQFQQQCNTPFVVADLASYIPFGLHGSAMAPEGAFVGPRPSVGSQSANEYYLAFIGNQFAVPRSLYVAHLGQDGASFSGVEPLFRSTAGLNVVSVDASDRYIAYAIQRDSGTRFVLLRYIGADGKPGGGDDAIYPIFDEEAVPGVRFAGISILGNSGIDYLQLDGRRLGLFLQYGDDRQRHLLLMTLAPNGPVNYEVPTASTIMRSYPSTHQITAFRIADSGAITLLFRDMSQNPNAVHFFDFMSPGLDGLWNNGGDEQRITFGNTLPTSLSSGPEFSTGGRYAIWTSVANNRRQLSLFGAGPDRIPGTPDDDGLFNITPPPQNFLEMFPVDVGDNIQATPLARASAVRALVDVPLRPGASRFHFFESGADQLPGSPDVFLAAPNGPDSLFIPFKFSALASEANVMLFTHETLIGGSILRAIRLCYQ